MRAKHPVTDLIYCKSIAPVLSSNSYANPPLQGCN